MKEEKNSRKRKRNNYADENDDVQKDNLNQSECDENDCQGEQTEGCSCEHENCSCEDCQCEHECCECEECAHECDCENEHNCAHEHGKHHHCHDGQEYLVMAQRLQADFENYRKHVAEQLDKERQQGAESVIRIFLPCLDTFKEAKKSIDDEKILAGINMIEDKILDALKSLKVEKIEAIGNKFDPHIHNVIACMSNPDKEEDIVLDEYQSGWTMNGKVIRYSSVIVNKHS